MQNQKIYVTDRRLSYNKLFKISEEQYIRYYSPHELSKITRKKECEFIGEFAVNSKKEEIARFSVEGADLPLYKYKDHKRLIWQEVGYIQCEDMENAYVVLLKNRFMLIIFFFLFALLGIVLAMGLYNSSIFTGSPPIEENNKIVGVPTNPDITSITGSSPPSSANSNSKDTNSLPIEQNDEKDTSSPPIEENDEIVDVPTDPNITPITGSGPPSSANRNSKDTIRVQEIKSVTIPAYTKEVKFLLKNSPENDCYMFAEIKLVENGETIAKTGMIPPGHKVDKISLINNGLPPGQYKASLREEHYSMDNSREKLNSSITEFYLFVKSADL